MTNTTQENALARQAAQLLLIQYRQYISDTLLQTIGCAGDVEMQHYVKFYDDPAFRKILLTFDPAPPQGCRVSATTDRSGKPLIVTGADGTSVVSGTASHSVVYINRSCASAGTVVHELLHAVSHMNWYMWSAFQKPSPNEGVTEWLTRKALKHATAPVFQNIDRSAAYQMDYQNFKTAKAQMKQDVNTISDELKAAYFRGEIRPNLTMMVGMFQSASMLATQGEALVAAAAFAGRGGRKR